VAATTGTKAGIHRTAGEPPRELANGTFAVLHGLALRDTLEQLPDGCDGLVRDGLVQSTPAGYALTPLGHRRHRALLEMERRVLDLGLLEMAYAGLPAMTRQLREIVLEWEASDDPGRWRLVGRLCAIVEHVELLLRRSAAVAPRFADYLARLDAAKRRLLDSDLEYAVGPGVESILTVWREMNEDYLQTLGCAHDQDDL
jgi:hypothetical protein